MTRDFVEHPAGPAPMTTLPLGFEAFHRMHRPAYVRWAKTYLNNKADAEEAVDWAFEQLLKAWPEVLAKENPTAYAWQVTKNRTIDVRRERGRREALVDTAAFETAALREAVDPIGQADEDSTDLVTRTAQISAVLDYVPAAVAYVDDDLDLPLPDADFTDRITSMTTAPATRARPHNPLAPITPPEHQAPHGGALSLATAARPASFASGPSTSPTTATPQWKWNDSGGAFGHRQRLGNFAAARRREQAWQAFWEHCEECADCDPSGIPCPAYGTLR